MSERTRIIWIPGWGCIALAMRALIDAVDECGKEQLLRGDRHVESRRYEHVFVDWNACLRDWLKNWGGTVRTGSDLPIALDGTMAAAAGPVILAGASLGGMLALRAAAMRPDKVAAVIAVGSTLQFTHERNHPRTSEKLRAMTMKLSRDKYSVLFDFFTAAFAPENETERVVFYANRGEENFHHQELERGLEYLAKEDLTQIAEKISAPCLQIHGGEDRIIAPACGDLIAEHVHDVTREILPTRGHLLPVVAGGYTGEVIRKFLNARI